MATADAAEPEGINLIKYLAAANPLLKGLALVACLGFVLASQAVLAQETATPNDVRDERSGAYALINATIHVDARTTVEDRVLLIREGLVESMADSVPAGYVSIDLEGHHIFPSLIELDSGYGLPDPDKPAPFSFSAAEVLEP